MCRQAGFHADGRQSVLPLLLTPVQEERIVVREKGRAMAKASLLIRVESHCQE